MQKCGLAKKVKGEWLFKVFSHTFVKTFVDMAMQTKNWL